MPWPLFLAETEEDRLRIGAVWEDEPPKPYSYEITGTLPNGLLLYVRIPNRIRWSPFYKVNFGGQWRIERHEGAIITVRPSISYPDQYHGWLTDGVLSDDLEGRRYDANGNLIR